MRRWAWSGAAIVAIAAALPLALYAIGSAAPPDGKGPPKGRPHGPPAAIELAPSPLRIACDGVDASTLRVRLTDDNGKPVADGTDVFFDVRYGFADPVKTQTSKGDASTQVRLYPYAFGAFPEPEVFVYAGDLRASINIGCGGGGDPNCNPFSPPQPPSSPPCPTPCAPTASPPCVPATPCASPSPPCITATPCASPSPPCTTPTPTPCGAPTSPPCAAVTATATATPSPTATPVNALYELGLFGQTQANDTVTLAVYILDLGGGPYAGVQWHVDYDEQHVDLISMQRASPAPEGCAFKSDDGSRALLGCLNVAPGETLDYFGDAWILTFGCLADGVFDYRLETDPSIPSPSLVFDVLGNPLPIQTTDTQVGCGKDISTPAPTETPSTPFPCTDGPGCVTPTPTPLFQLGLSATESGGIVTAELYIRDVGGGAYEAVQWHLDYPEALFDVVSIEPAPGAPADCAQQLDLGDSLLAACFAAGGGDNLSYFGTSYIVTFDCLGPGAGQLSLTDDAFPSFVAANGLDSVPIDQLSDSGPGWSCSGVPQ